MALDGPGNLLAIAAGDNEITLWDAPNNPKDLGAVTPLLDARILLNAAQRIPGSLETGCRTLTRGWLTMKYCKLLPLHSKAHTERTYWFRIYTTV
jgi:hypothetical protein